MLFISPAVRMLWVALQMGSCRSSSLSHPGPAFTPCRRKMQPCCAVMPHWHCASPQASSLPIRPPGTPSDSGTSRAFSAIDCPIRGRSVMRGLILALRHSSAYFFEISRWGDKRRRSTGRAGAVSPGGQGAAPAPRILAAGRGPGSLPRRAGAPSSPGGFFLSCLSLRPKANSRVPAQFG